MRAKSIAPSDERKPPEIFGLRGAAVAFSWLLVKGTVAS